MNKDFAAAMREAARSVRAFDVVQATRTIQNALRVGFAADPRDATFSDSAWRDSAPRTKQLTLDSGPGNAKLLVEEGSLVAQPDGAGTPTPDGCLPFKPSRCLRMPLGDVLRTLRTGRQDSEALDSVSGSNLSGLARSYTPPVPEGAQFLRRSFACAAGRREYKLFVPAASAERPRGLVVMLHGCKQNPDDFASGTNMNAIAGAQGLLVAYPAQPPLANASGCWNWFNPADQMRDAGEPSIIAGLTREVISEFDLDRRQVFVAGLSAGGAMALVMGETYPELYAAVGVHSGLAYKSANDVVSAFAAMGGKAGSPAHGEKTASGTAQSSVRTIVFQGSADRTVDPSNARRIVAEATPDLVLRQRQDRGHADGGRGYTQTVISGADGVSVVEYWVVEGGRHAWSGGRSLGSHTDPRGPNASAEMVRFFLKRPPTGGSL
jgi:poly(hydroxyalkanoate) depolymerase family esterase